MLNENDKAPAFSLAADDGRTVTLESLKGKPVVLYFYPKDDTSGCTREACAFRDSYEDFQDAGADVIGVSGGTTEGKQKFIRSNRLPFTLLNDADGAVQAMYGIGKALLGFSSQRITYVIDREGVIRHKFESNFNMEAHARDALQIVRALAKQQVR
jgi:peroxiredoxin Q/BCP